MKVEMTEPTATELTVHPGSPLTGTISSGGVNSLPGDKSLSHRAAVLAALAVGESRIDNFQVSGVTRPMLEALTLLGVPWELHGESLRVQGRGLAALQAPPQVIDCGNSGTTLRLLAGLLAAANLAAVLDGSSGLRRRPMRRIVEPLRRMGVEIEDTDGHAPLILRPSPRPLRPLDETLPVASAQVKSCLLLAALASNGAGILREPGPSRDHTERMLASLGVTVHSTLWHENPDASLVITTIQPPTQPLALPPLQVSLPGDPSAAAFLIVAALITPGSHIRLEGVLLNPTRIGLIEALQAMGASVQVEHTGTQAGEPVGALTVTHSRLHGGQVSGERVVRMIDEFPAYAVAAAYARGRTRVRQAAELRTKESDRITALAGELRALGVQIEEAPDGFDIAGDVGVQGGDVQSHGDHRLAMALAVAGLDAQSPVHIRQTGVIAESFPGFVGILKALGAHIQP